VLWGLLRFKQRGARYVQSLTAVYGSDFLLGLLILPLLGASLLLPEHSAGLAVVTAIGGALYPAFYAMRIEAAEALRYE